MLSDTVVHSFSITGDSFARDVNPRAATNMTVFAKLRDNKLRTTILINAASILEKCEGGHSVRADLYATLSRAVHVPYSVRRSPVQATSRYYQQYTILLGPP